MTNDITLFMLAGLLLLAACRTTASSEDAPALITHPTSASHAALQKAINDALDTSVLIADDALTASSILTVERRQARSMQGQPATGRNMEPPFQFRLVIDGASCILIDARDESRRALENTTCIAR
jgi:hypothetical protein